MLSRPTTAVVLIVLAAVPLSACKSQQEVRALPMVRESAARAYTYGNYDLAVTEYREVVMRKPGYWQDRLEYAKALLAANRPGEAREQMEILYTSKPNRFDVLDMLAKSMVASRDVEGMARVMKDEAYARNTPRDWVRYGWYMAVAGDADEGEWALKRGAELDRGRNAGPQMALGELYRASGDTPNAIKRYRMAQAIEPQNEEVRAALIALGQDPDPANAIVPAEASLPPSQRASEKRPTASVTVPDR